MSSDRMAYISGSDYKPSNVRMTFIDGFYVATDFDGSELIRTPDRAVAQHRLKVRRGVIQAALTRRANKRTAVRVAACKRDGVTWAWLVSDLTPHEADAWLGIES